MGVRVAGGGYNFHFKDNKMYFANGHYVKIKGLDPVPSVTPEMAKSYFSEYLKIPEDSIHDFDSELMIREIVSIGGNDTSVVPKLVYRIHLRTNYYNITEVGIVDAHTGEVLKTEPAFSDLSSTGFFATRYSGIQSGTTEYYSSVYNLADFSRGATIHTWNLENSTNLASKVELTDNNNYWTEHAPYENNMGLDVHWALQNIYDHLYDNYGINSYDDAVGQGCPITAYIRFGNTVSYKDNAAWDHDDTCLVFGDGANLYSPVASLDAVGHEYGHGITDFQIGWGPAGNEGALNEGLSDIWGAIFEYRIRPSSTWKILEQISLTADCERNLQFTTDEEARVPIADTYLSEQYTEDNGSNNKYVRGGVFSHWFYMLVNGETGTNDLGHSYKVYGVGFDEAEDLIVEAVFNNYLDNTDSYLEVRTAMENAARSLCGGQNRVLVHQVESAWYAAGVGINPPQPSLNGSDVVCFSSSSFYVVNQIPGCTTNWAYSSNLFMIIEGSNYIVLRGRNAGSGWVRPTITSTCGSITLPQKSVWVGPPSTPSSIQFMDEDPFCIGPQNIYQFGVTVPSYVDSWDWDLQPPGIIVGSDSNPLMNFYYPNGTQENTYSVGVRAINTCGASSFHTEYFDVIDCEFRGFSFNIYPTPATDQLTVEMIADEALAVRPEIETEIRLYDFKMMEVRQKKFTGNKTILNVNNLPNGLYILQILIDGNKYEFANTTDGRAKQFSGNKTYWEKVQIQH